MITDAFREECGRAGMARRDAGVHARGDRPSQRRYAPENGARGAVLTRARMKVRAAASGGLTEFQGVATVYERGYEMWDMFGPYTEVVSAGAGTESLKRADLDVPLVLQHQDLRRIARTTNGSLILAETDDGLDVSAPELDMRDHDVAYIVPKIEARLVDEMSFKFRIVTGQWSPDYSEYRINAYDIHRGDVAICGYGANPATSATITQRARPAQGAELASLLDLAIAG